MEIKTHDFKKTLKKEIQNTTNKDFLGLLPVFLSALRQMALSTFPDPAAAQKKGAAIRAEALANLPALLENFEKNATAAGAKVFWARDAAEANEYVLRLAQKKGVDFITKGKSMITEELGLNDYLGRNGIQAVETDLGELIIQLLERPPFHIVGPAINIPVNEVRDLFMEKIGLKNPTTDPVELGYAARLYLREKFKKAEMGVTGVNFAVAETGSIINVENEGNIRFNKSSPQTQVSIMSLEKVVPTLADAMHMLRLVCRNCTGQKLSSYVTIDTGPRRDKDLDGPEELHIIILDNGRTKIYENIQTREALQCIRCGACLNICPVYCSIGGYPYGWVYSGPMGQVLNPLLLGLGKTQDLYNCSTLCRACESVCPAGIRHTNLFLYYRSKNIEGDNALQTVPPGILDKMKYKIYAGAAKSETGWKIASKLAKTTIKCANKKGTAPAPLKFWLEKRDLPDETRDTFHERWKKLK